MVDDHDSDDHDFKVTPRQRAFLSAYRITGCITRAARLAGIHRNTHHRWTTESPSYVEAFADARDEAGDHLEAEARRRAVEGVDEPVFGSMGAGAGTGQVGVVRKYSDALLIVLLKGAKPEKYTNRHEVGGKGQEGALLLEAIVAGGRTER